MKDFDAIKDIWHGQVEMPKLSYDDLLKGIKTSKRSFENKLLFESIAMLSAILLFGFIWINNASMMWTTHLALLIFLVCCIVFF